MLRVWLWRCLTAIFVFIGLVGVVLPGLPTTPFMLLALWSSSKGWPIVHEWLLTHPKFGPHLQRWQEERAIPQRAKIMATTMIIFSAIAITFTVPLVWVQWLLYSTLAAVLIWLWWYVPN